MEIIFERIGNTLSINIPTTVVYLSPPLCSALMVLLSWKENFLNGQHITIHDLIFELSAAAAEEEEEEEETAFQGPFPWRGR